MLLTLIRSQISKLILTSILHSNAYNILNAFCSIIHIFFNKKYISLIILFTSFKHCLEQQCNEIVQTLFVFNTV